MKNSEILRICWISIFGLLFFFTFMIQIPKFVCVCVILGASVICFFFQMHFEQNTLKESRTHPSLMKLEKRQNTLQPKMQGKSANKTPHLNFGGWTPCWSFCLHPQKNTKNRLAVSCSEGPRLPFYVVRKRLGPQAKGGWRITSFLVQNSSVF